VLYFANTKAYSGEHRVWYSAGFYTRPKPDRAGINPAPYEPLCMLEYVTAIMKPAPFAVLGRIRENGH